HCQDSLRDAFEAGDLDRDVVAVVRFQGPAANGMPELHKMTPYLGSLQDRGFNVALITDGRMSGASGKVPAAIHLTPEAIHGGPIALLRDGDIVELDTIKGTLTAQVPEQEWLLWDATCLIYSATVRVAQCWAPPYSNLPKKPNEETRIGSMAGGSGFRGNRIMRDRFLSM
ncbi:MAG: dihydroxyacid dehydratase/phosphogluconate dehydratase, partial [Halieaceae bacterium]